MSYVLLIIGFVLLIKGADFFVEGSASVAKKFHIPALIIGMTIIAMGTSAPECAVSISASLKGNNEMAISNVIGSNIFNLLVVCGACALFSPLTVQLSILKREFPFCILTGVLLLVTCYIGMVVGRVDGIIFLLIFVAFIVFMIISSRKSASSGDDDIKERSMPVSIVFIIGGIAAIVCGANLVVNASSDIAASFGLSQTLIGLTVVACGTSLPELVTSLVAAKKGQVDMALGNVIGSNLFNILFVLGSAAAISPIAVINNNIIDLIIMFVVSIIVWFFSSSGRKIDRKEGICMLAMYIIYLVYICVR